MNAVTLTYTQRIIPEPYTILGLSLRPFSLGHFLLLQRFNCGFVSDKPTLGGIDDLILGCCVCSMTYEEFLDAITDDKLFYTKESVFTKKSIRKEISFKKWLKKWAKSVEKDIYSSKEFNLYEKIQLFKNYINSGVKAPYYYEGERFDNVGESGGHWTQAILLVLTGELGFTHSQALNLPMAEVFVHYFKYAENNGIITLMNEEESMEVDLAKAEKESHGVS